MAAKLVDSGYLILNSYSYNNTGIENFTATLQTWNNTQNLTFQTEYAVSTNNYDFIKFINTTDPTLTFILCKQGFCLLPSKAQYIYNGTTNAAVPRLELRLKQNGNIIINSLINYGATNNGVYDFYTNNIWNIEIYKY